MKYSCLPHPEYRKGEYSIVPFREEDLMLIRKWRNEQMAILRQKKPLTKAQQIRYYEEQIKPTYSEKKPGQLLFSYLAEDKCIGYGGLVYIDWEIKRAEVSFLLATERMKDDALFQGEFARFLNLLLRVAEDLKLHRLYTESFDIRPQLVEVLMAFGFHLEGLLKDHAMIDGKYVDSLIHGIILD